MGDWRPETSGRAMGDRWEIDGGEMEERSESKENFECHGHIFMNGTDYRSAAVRHRDGPEVSIVRAHLAALRDSGIVYFREGGDPFGVSLLARRLAPEYGIEYRTPAFAIHRQGYYGGIVGFGYSTLAEYRALVRRAKGEGADFIKVMFSGLLDFNTYGSLSCPSLSAEEIHTLVHVAHDAGFAVMAHVNGAAAIRAAIAAGTDSIEHGYFMDDACVDLLADSNTIWVPTLTAIAAFSHRPGFSGDVVKQILSGQYHMLRRAAQAGAFIAIGSDSGAVGVPHGEGAHRERALLLDVLGPEGERLTEHGNRILAGRFKRL